MKTLYELNKLKGLLANSWKKVEEQLAEKAIDPRIHEDIQALQGPN
ncbi:hypothetical protein P7H22_11825 [Paenibacillus larvae]|nr:hypothetical protein [Paenibacillus larvae]MDT2240904.1 hypothetical protein [Paenibacillus larvae]